MSVKYVSLCTVPAPASEISGGNTSWITDRTTTSEDHSSRYADDVTIFVTDPSNVPTIRHAIHRNELATGARLNPQKSRALQTAGWTHPATTLTILFKDRIEILRVNFGPTIAHSRSDSWAKLVRAVLVWHVSHMPEHYVWNNAHNT